MKLSKGPCLLIFTVFILLAAGLQSCKKKKSDPDSTPAPAPHGTVMLHFHTNVDTNEVELYNQVYLVTGGRKISVSLAQLYVSGIQLIRADGSFYNLPDLTILKVMEVEEYLGGLVPAGNYRSIRFNVGLSPATNAATPSTGDSTLNKPVMWFGNTAQASGFVFLNFQGKIDTSASATASVSQMQPFSYRIGTNAHLTPVVMSDKNYAVLPDQVQFIHITIDYAQLFNGIALNHAANLMVNSVSDNAGAVAGQVANNIPAMFRYEE